MKKLLYIAPAFIVCMFVGSIGLLFGFGAFNAAAWGYLVLSVLGSALLCKGKWWGCFFGAAVGGMLLYNGMTAQPQLFAGFVIGLILIAYYVLMGLVCVFSRKK